MEGRQLWYGRTPGGLKKSISLFQQAITADSNYALAYTGLADTYNVVPSYGIGINSRQAQQLADESARKALALDDSLSEAHTALGMALATEWKWSEAEAEFRRAIELNPNNSTAHYFYAFTVLNANKRTDEALHELQTALSLDPLSPIVNCNYGMMLMEEHRYPEALAQIQTVLNRDPNFGPAHYKLSELYATIGRMPEAVTEMKKGIPENTAGLDKVTTYPEAALLFPGTDTFTPSAYAYAIVGNRDKAFELLEKAFAARDGELLLSIRYPGFDSLRSDPRFKDLLHRMGLSE